MSALKILRNLAGKTQEEAAEAMHVSVQTIQSWEKTGKFRYPEDLHSLLDYYGVDSNVRKAVVWEIYGNEDCPGDMFSLKVINSSRYGMGEDCPGDMFSLKVINSSGYGMVKEIPMKNIDKEVDGRYG